MNKQSAAAFRARVREIESRAGGTADVTFWTPEQIEARLAEIGPDKNWEVFHKPKKSSEVAITAPRQKLNGSYYKPGESW